MGIFQQFPYTNFHEMNLDQIIKIMREMQDEWEATKAEWASYKDFIDNYFANLNLDEETEKALRVLVADGTLDPVIDPVIASETADWLNEHVTPTTPIVDASLTISGAAADAKVTGDNFNISMMYVGSVADLDNARLNSVGVDSGSALNKPTTGAGYVLTYGNNTTKIQLWIGYTQENATYYRRYTGGSWGSWRHYDFQYRGALTDLNDAEINSICVDAGSAANSPASGVGVVLTYGSNTTKIQIWIGHGTEEIEYYRKYSSGSWGSWCHYNFQYFGTLADLNDAELNSICIDNGSALNKPTSGSGYVMTYGSGSTKIQIWVGYTQEEVTYYRRFSGGSWGSWRHYTFQYLGAVADINDAELNSICVDAGSAANSPASGVGIVFTFGNPSTKSQIWMGYNTGNVWYRHYVLATLSWGSWISKNASQNSLARMFSIGNSILTGSVWTNGSFDHLAQYGNAPYGVIANALNIPKENVTHVLHSSTGLLYDAGEGSFLSNILNTDISSYDVVLTHMWTADMNNYNVGTLNDPAGLTTLVGAVKTLINYLKTNNPNAKLVLVSVPPSSTTISGNNVFTGLYSNGSSIADLDTVMHDLAESLHFTYVDFQQLNISYYYQSLTDGSNVHLNNENSYRAMGAYLAGRASAEITF